MKESTLVRNIIRAVRAKYPRAYVRKLADRFSRGLPDLLILFPTPLRDVQSRCLLVEAKTDEGTISPVQAREHQEIHKADGIIITARSANEVLDALEKLGAVGQIP